jgi:hypothetical protein
MSSNIQAHAIKRRRRSPGCFLATEVLFFGALFLTWIYSRHWNQAGFDAGAQQTELAIGSINTVILVVSSFVYSAGVAFVEAGNSRRLIQCCAAAWALGVAFLVLKFGIEWRDDFNKQLSPGPALPSTVRLAAGRGSSSSSISSAQRCTVYTWSSGLSWSVGLLFVRGGRSFLPVITRRLASSVFTGALSIWCGSCSIR